MTRFSSLVAAMLALPAVGLADDPKDWPSYNGGAAGWRHNSGETALGAENAGKLVEKWRFPAVGDDRKIGVVHATPVVVDGYVYFGTVTQPAFYALHPNGKLKWSYQIAARSNTKNSGREESPGVYGSSLVTEYAVYFGDLAGFFYALDRGNGQERWKVDTRDANFPDAHPLNGTFASPILADGKVIFVGGAFEQWYANRPGYKACTGRAYVVALDPKSGKIAWKYDVGPKPEPLDPP